jgi:hypothetical protein
VWGGPGALDGLTDGPHDGPGTIRVVRARETHAPPDALFLWLSQLRRAPYSYDWIDNVGRRSPRTPDLTLPDMRPGVPVMRIFTLKAVVPGRSMTIRMNDGAPTRRFGALTVRYEIEPLSETRSRLRSVMWMPRPAGRWGGARRYLLAWGDLVMSTRQLRVLCRLAEGTTGPT